MEFETPIIENFRGYEEENRISFTDMTTVAGKDDTGKPSAIEALEIFFDNNW